MTERATFFTRNPAPRPCPSAPPGTGSSASRCTKLVVFDGGHHGTVDDVACVLAESAMTNIGMVLPRPRAAAGHA
ncbi:hypothetical protein [uncultured Sphaerotilus sp.]|uniref:hypothetical protein n=1 Tax=uncultured Sphaerotilus sp. TaxID=474984 RepID=UPI0030CA583B